MARPIRSLAARATVLVALLVCAAPAPGQERDVDRELEAARQRVERLLESADRAEREGAREAARVARREAEMLRRRIDEHRERLAAERRPGSRGHLHEILEELEHGIAAVEKLDEPELRRRLGALADRIRRELRAPERRSRRELHRPHDERLSDTDRLEAMHAAMNVLREAEHHEAADALEHALRGHERHGHAPPSDAAHGPDEHEIRGLLELAGDLCRERGMIEHADRLHEAAVAWPTARRPHGPDQRRERRSADRVQSVLDALRRAAPALRELEHMDAGDLLELGLRAHEMMHGEREARSDRAHVVELLEIAADLWTEFDDEQSGDGMRRLADRLRRQPPSRAERDRRTERRERLEIMREELRELRRMVEGMGREMRELRRP